MRRNITLTFLFLFSCICFSSLALAAIYTGGNGSGWNHFQVTPSMYRGGSGDGNSASSTSADAAMGYSTATKLAFTTSPSNAYAGVAFATQPVVEVRDALDNKVSSATNTVTLSINNDAAGSSTLGGTVQMAAVAGVADFSGKGVYVSRAASGFTLSAVATSLTSATSSSFNILSPIQVTSPNGSEVWAVSTSHDVTWTTYGSLATGTNTMQYSLNNGSTWANIPGSVTSPYSWATPSTPSTQVLVRITNSADATYTDTSDAVFKITAAFSVIAPNGAEIWANGFAHIISWVTSGTVANVKLEYYNGSVWATIVDSTSNSTNQYSWTPSVSSGGTGFKIRVSDVTDPDVNDESNSAFTLQKIALTAPTLDQRIQAGTSSDITWTSAGITNVKIEYSVNDGLWTQITGAESITASLGTYSWSVPSDFTASTNVKVRVSSTAADSDSNTASSTSSAFTVYGKFTITSPSDSGIEWQANTAQTITWTTDNGTISDVKLEYSSDNFVSDINTIVSSTSNNGSYSWTPTVTGTTFTVRVSDVLDSQTYDISDNYFSIIGIGITAPASGATWNCGSSQTISWTYTGSFTHVKIEYHDGTQWNTIASSAPNNNSYSWTVATTATTSAQIRISDATDSDPTTTSSTFNIKAPITVTAPNGGDSVNIEGSTNITWTNTGTINNVKLEYYNGSSWVTIEDSFANTTPASGGTYPWTIPNAATALAKVRVSDADAGHPASNDESDAVFNIQSAFTITSPTSGLNWAVNESHAITWTNTGTVGQIRLYYATENDSYATWTEITSAATTNNNTYSWTVSDIILAIGQAPQTDDTLAVKVKVVDATDGHPASSGPSNAFNVIYYTITFTVKDSQSGAHLAGLGVSCSSGWSASSLTSGINTTRNYPYGTYTTIWSKSDYTDANVTDWTADSDKTNAVTMTLSTVASQEYHVYSNFTYDAASDAFLINSWLEKSGAIVTDPTSCTVSMEDKDGAAIDINGATAGNNLTSSSLNSNGVFRQTWDLTNINRNTTYFGKAQIVNGGTTYSSNVTYAIAVPAVSALSTVSGNVSSILTSVGSNLGIKVDTISSNVSSMQSDMGLVKTAVGGGESTTLYSKVTSVLEDTGATIPATITSELKKGPRSKILNRPTSVDTGSTVTVRYKTDSGLSPTITAYNADNTACVSSQKMTEIGTTGVYEYDVTFSSAWGIGDYTIICSESTINSSDSMIISVGTASSLSSIESKIDALTTSLNTVSTNVNSIKTIVGTTSDASTSDTLYGKLAGVSSNVSTLITSWGNDSISDIISYVDNLEEYLGSPNDTSGKLTVFGKIAAVSSNAGTVPSVAADVTSAYNEIQELRKEINFNGKSSTAYNLISNIDATVSEIKESIPGISTELKDAGIKEVAASVEETKEALKKAVSQSGLKGLSEEGKKKAPATIEGLQNQLGELKALIEAMKAMMQEKQEPVVKTWFEKSE